MSELQSPGFDWVRFFDNLSLEFLLLEIGSPVLLAVLLYLDDSGVGCWAD
jgi:hypothetical protein